jgi:Tfp pilus assembly protein PilN
MRALQLDYQRTYKPAPRLGLGVLVAALVALAAMAGYHQTLNEQTRYWQNKADQVKRLPGHRAAVSPPLTQHAARAQMLEVKQANQVVRQLGLPWNALFNAVESSGGKEIALLSLEPDLQKGVVTIGGEAKDFDALLNYVKELSARELFASVMLQNHQIQRDIAEKPVRFSLIAHLKGVAP